VLAACCGAEAVVAILDEVLGTVTKTARAM